MPIAREEFELALSHVDTFRHLFTPSNEEEIANLMDTVAGLRGQLTQFILENPVVFFQTMDTPELFWFELSDITCGYPNERDRVWQIFETNLNLLQQIPLSYSDVEPFINTFPEYNDRLFQIFIETPENFQKMVTEPSDQCILTELNKVFPGHEDIFQQPTVADALKVVTDRAAAIRESERSLRQNARILAQGRCQKIRFSPIFLKGL